MEAICFKNNGCTHDICSELFGSFYIIQRTYRNKCWNLDSTSFCITVPIRILDLDHAAQERIDLARKDMLVLEIRVRPNSKVNRVGGSVGNPRRLIVRVQEPAVEGKANVAVLRELAAAFGIRIRDLSIVFGELSRDKRIQIAGERSLLEVRYQELLGVLTLF